MCVCVFVAYVKCDRQKSTINRETYECLTFLIPYFSSSLSTQREDVSGLISDAGDVLLTGFSRVTKLVKSNILPTKGMPGPCDHTQHVHTPLGTPQQCTLQVYTGTEEHASGMVHIPNTTQYMWLRLLSTWSCSVHMVCPNCDSVVCWCLQSLPIYSFFLYVICPCVTLLLIY